MKRRAWRFLVAGAGLWAAAAHPVAQVFRTMADAVLVDVLVIDRNRPVAGLTPEDFVLRDNGVLQRPEFSAVRDVPLTVVLALDVSESVKGAKLESLRVAVTQLEAALRPDDRVLLVTFSDEVRSWREASPPLSPLVHALSAVTPKGATSLHDATFTALAMATGASGRALVIVFSDGQDTSSWGDPRRIVRAFERSNVVVYGVVLGESIEVAAPADAVRLAREREWFEQAPHAYGRHFLPRLTAATGGSVVVADEIAHLRETFSSVIGEFRARYVLSYSPTGVSPTGWHDIDVSLKEKRGTVRARRGYLRGHAGPAR